MKKTLLILCLFSALNSTAQDNWTAEPVNYTFESHVFKQDRTISIYLPELYYSEPEQSLPVAFLFDGQFGPYLQMTAGAMEYYQQVDEGPGFILVSIHSPERWFDFTMPIAGDDREDVGGADLLTKHLRTEVLPYLDSNYRTTDFHLGIAHSLGGTYAIYEFFKEESLFNAIIAASPNTIYHEGLPVDKVSEFLNSVEEKHAFAYVGVGDIDDIEQWFEEGLNEMDSIIELSNLPGLKWNSVRMENESHMSSYLRLLDDGLHALNKALSFDGDDVKPILSASEDKLMEAINAVWLEKQKFTQETGTVNSEGLISIVRALRNLDEHKKAIQVAEIRVEKMREEGIDKTEIEKAEKGIKYLSFYQYTTPAGKALKNKEYEKAAELYLEAMKMETLNGTHVIRLRAAEAFAQTNHFDDAFKQLELLANHFGWRGRETFEESGLLNPLHKDERWEPLMEVFDKN